MAIKITAPNVAVNMDPRPKLPVLPATPSTPNTQPPINAPTIPIRAVATMPPGSGPGMTHFARMPAMSPTTTQTTMAPMLMALHLPRLHRVRTGRYSDGIYTRRCAPRYFRRFYPRAGGHKHCEEYLWEVL